MFRIVPLSPRRKTLSAGSRPQIDPFRQSLCQQVHQGGILLVVQPLLGVDGAASRARWKNHDYFAPRLSPPKSRGFRHHLPTQRQAPEKRYFRWQKTRRTLWGLRQRMDVRFCESRNHRREALVRAAGSGRFVLRAPHKRASTRDLHGRRQTGSNSVTSGSPVTRRERASASRNGCPRITPCPSFLTHSCRQHFLPLLAFRHRTVLRGREHFELRQGCWANLQDHIRNDVAVRSIAGSVVLKDCTLS